MNKKELVTLFYIIIAFILIDSLVFRIMYLFIGFLYSLILLLLYKIDKKKKRRLEVESKN